jgi:hypothetical protein
MRPSTIDEELEDLEGKKLGPEISWDLLDF